MFVEVVTKPVYLPQTFPGYSSYIQGKFVTWVVVSVEVLVSADLNVRRLLPILCFLGISSGSLSFLLD